MECLPRGLKKRSSLYEMRCYICVVRYFFEPMLDYRIKVRLTFCESSFISILGAWYENQC